MKVSILPVTTYQQNCSLLICETTNEAALVDPGGDIEFLLAEIAAEEAKLTSIILTHGHLDHVGATAELIQRFAVPVYGPHKNDAYLIENIPDYCDYFGFAACESFTPTKWLKEGDKVFIGEEILQVFHCPGHTPGHIILFHPKMKLALVGDVLFKGAIGRTDLAQGNHQQLLHSIKHKLLPLGADVRFIPGHGPMSSFGDEMRNNPFI